MEARDEHGGVLYETVGADVGFNDVDFLGAEAEKEGCHSDEELGRI